MELLEALVVAKTLREREELTSALRIAEHGLTLQDPRGQAARSSLATWLCDLAAGMGETERALQAAIAAFRAVPSLAAYLKVQSLAGEAWSKLRVELLDHLRRTDYYDRDRVDVFLHEGLFDDAIAVVDEDPGYDLLGQVVDAVIEHRPEWVIGAACQQAERIMDAGQAKYYRHAVGWLDRARRAYLAAGRQADWQAYLCQVYSRHGRKTKLMGMLRGMGG